MGPAQISPPVLELAATALESTIFRLPAIMLKSTVNVRRTMKEGGEPDVGQHDVHQAMGIAAQDDVSAAAGHVGGNGDAARQSRLRDDLRLLCHVRGLCIQHVDAHARRPAQGAAQAAGMSCLGLGPGRVS